MYIHIIYKCVGYYYITRFLFFYFKRLTICCINSQYTRNTISKSYKMYILYKTCYLMRRRRSTLVTSLQDLYVPMRGFTKSKQSYKNDKEKSNNPKGESR